MNVENHFRPGVGQIGGSGGRTAFAGAAGEPSSPVVGGQAPLGDRPLTVRAAAKGSAAEAAGRIDPAHEAEALAPDRLDALIKSVLDFAPPPMPNFDIMSENSL